MRINTPKQIITLLVSISLLHFSAFPQTKRTATECEQAIHLIDSSLYFALKKLEKLLIIVLRPNKKEKSKVIRKRGTVLENFCELRNRKNKCLVTIGNPVDDLGTAELYVEGELYETIYYAKNNVGSCAKQ
jgi:hypothetical protein